MYCHGERSLVAPVQPPCKQSPTPRRPANFAGSNRERRASTPTFDDTLPPASYIAEPMDPGLNPSDLYELLGVAGGVGVTGVLGYLLVRAQRRARRRQIEGVEGS